MCETSKTPQASRTRRCSARIPSYSTGISQPENGTSFAPASTCASYRGVLFSVPASTLLTLPRGRCASVPGDVARTRVEQDDVAVPSRGEQGLVAGRPVGEHIDRSGRTDAVQIGADRGRDARLADGLGERVRGRVATVGAAGASQDR